MTPNGNRQLAYAVVALVVLAAFFALVVMGDAVVRALFGTGV